MAKLIRKCQVCDGPIVNGRCKLCGMPYRNDEELYHLNENRRDHYTHASAEVRKKMESESTSYRKRLAPKEGSPAASARTPGRRETAPRPGNASGNNAPAGKNTSGAPKKSGSSIGAAIALIWMIIVLMMSFRACMA